MPTIQFPDKIKPLLFSNKRIKVAHGGRGGGKSTSFATFFILKALERRCRIYCTREIQKSIDESVHALISKRIREMGLQDKFEIQAYRITAINGSEFFYGGLFRNLENNKGIDDVDYWWIEEGQTVSEESLQILFPSIRKEGAEVWISFNPRYESDPVYKRYIVNPDPDAEVVEIQWYDNPWISNTLIAQKDSDRIRLPNEYKHIWEGQIKHYGGFIWVPPFNDKIHVKDFHWHLIKDKVNVVMGLDLHQHYYPAAIWLAMIKNSNGTIYKWVFAEYPTVGKLGGFYSDVRKKIIFDGSLNDLTRDFKAIELEHNVKVLRRYIDTRFAKGIGGAGFSPWTTKTDGVVEQWKRIENGALSFIGPREGIIDAQRSVIKDYLRYNPEQAINELNEPTLFISPSCKNLLQSLRNHRLEEDSEKEADTGLKDFSDVIRIAFAGIDTWNWVTEDVRSEYVNEYRSPESQSNAWQAM